jgi:hypothetical protein
MIDGKITQEYELNNKFVLIVDYFLEWSQEIPDRNVVEIPFLDTEDDNVEYSTDF